MLAAALRYGYDGSCHDPPLAHYFAACVVASASTMFNATTPLYPTIAAVDAYLSTVRYRTLSSGLCVPSKKAQKQPAPDRIQRRSGHWMSYAPELPKQNEIYFEDFSCIDMGILGFSII